MDLLMVENPEIVWAAVQPALDEIRVKNGYSWTTDQILEALQEGVARLFVSREDNGFVICRIDFHWNTGKPILWIWATYCKGFMQRKYLPAIEKIAKTIGADTIEMSSRRSPAAWMRSGWEIKEITYSRKVR